MVGGWGPGMLHGVRIAGDQELGQDGEDGEAEGVEQDKDKVSAGEVEFWDEEEVVGIKNTQHEHIDDEIALGGWVGEVGAEGEGFG